MQSATWKKTPRNQKVYYMYCTKGVKTICQLCLIHGLKAYFLLSQFAIIYRKMQRNQKILRIYQIHTVK